MPCVTTLTEGGPRHVEELASLVDHSPDDLGINAEVVVNDLVSQASDLLPGNVRVL